MNVSSGGGIVKVEQVAPSSYPFTLDFDSGTAVAIEAVPPFGHVFDGWSGDLSGSDNPATLMIDCDKTITANFSIDWLLVGSAAATLVVVALLISVLIIRRKTPQNASSPGQD